MSRLRIGHGFDVHAFASDRRLVIGGVVIPHDQGLSGHSDADVLVHAIADALLGAIGLPDIGQQFPPTDPQYKDIDSMILLRRVGGLVASSQYEIVNVDAVIMAQAPPMNPHIPDMKKIIAASLSCDADQISIKATTTERLGFVGRAEGIAASAVCLVDW